MSQKLPVLILTSQDRACLRMKTAERKAKAGNGGNKIKILCLESLVLYREVFTWYWECLMRRMYRVALAK